MAHGNCVDCGAPISTAATRCVKDRNAYLSRQGLRQSAERDRQIIDWGSTERLTGTRLAARLGVSPARANSLIRLARERERERQRLGL